MPEALFNVICPSRALTLDNTLVILSTVAPDAGRYYAQAVNDKNGENKTSQPVILNVESKYASGTKVIKIYPETGFNRYSSASLFTFHLTPTYQIQNSARVVILWGCAWFSNR